MQTLKKKIEKTSDAHKEASRSSSAYIVDNRPESILQRKEGFIDNRPLSIMLKSIHGKINPELEQSTNSEPNRSTGPETSPSNHTGLPDNLKSGIENMSGYSMDDVKVHYNSDKPVQLQAHAYAQGTNIHLGPGQEKHLPHEAWHVVQQKQGRVKPTVQMKEEVNINDDEGLEKEADEMGAKALSYIDEPEAMVQMKTRESEREISQTLQLKFIEKRGSRSLASIDGDSLVIQRNENVVQRAITQENADVKAQEFIAGNREEIENIVKVNELLAEYSRAQTLDLHETIQAQILVAKNAIRAIQDRQAALLGEYMDAESNENGKKAFLEQIIPNFQDEDAALVNQIAGKVQKLDDEQVDAEFNTLRNRYLSYIVQGLSTNTGKARLQEFGQLLGDKNIKLGGLGAEFGAGMLDDETDSPKSQKREDRNPIEDQRLLMESGGNIQEFINRRFGVMGAEDRRESNEHLGETGDVAVYLEKYQELFPIYLGLNASEKVEMFTSPLFTAMHHETGHLVNYLKGKSGGKNKYNEENDDALKALTDEEEVYNISVDQYSDKAMSKELEMPERIAHGSYLGISIGNPEITEEDSQASLDKWQKLTGNEEDQENLLRTLQNSIQELSIGDAGFRDNLMALLDEVKDWTRYLIGGVGITGEDEQRIADVIGWSLDKLEHKVYDRMNLYQRNALTTFIKTDEPELINIGSSLDAIQVEHRRYIAAIVDKGLNLWVSGSMDEKMSANRDWQALLENRSGIRIDDEASEEFKNETRSNIAKLMSRGEGRKLVSALMEEDLGLTISTASREQVLRLRAGLEAPGIGEEEIEEQLKQILGGQAGPVNSERASARQVEGGLERGEGSPSTMSMGTGISDSEGLSLNEEGGLILSPNFLELGHEMIHALQNLRGANVKGKNSEAYQNSPWENMSEHSVIAGTPEMQGLLGDDYVTENMLRDEHSLGVRFGHSTKMTLVNAIRLRLLAIANRPGWATKGGVIHNERFGSLPDGIQDLRRMLANQAPNWAAIKILLAGKTDRSKFSKFFKRVSDSATDFYLRVEEFCDLNPSATSDIAALREFLDNLKGFNPL